jgi:PBP1b-binding outer membrane lipoprotein LpoB
MLKSYLASAVAMLALIGCSASALPSESAVPAAVAIAVEADASLAPADLNLAAPAAVMAPAQIQRVQYQQASAMCDIVIRRTSNGALIEALVESDTSLDAEYSFDLDVSGSAGSSQISQGGEVILDAGDSAVVAQNEISLNRNSRGRAELTVFDEDGEVCSRTLRL